MIHHLFLACENSDDVVKLTEPPERMCKVQVIGGVCVMSLHDVDESTSEPKPEALGPLTEVSVESLMRALHVLHVDEQADLPDGWKALRPAPNGGPESKEGQYL